MKAKWMAGTLLALWLVTSTAGRLTAYYGATRVQTSIAVLLTAGLMLLVGYLMARGFGWIRPSEQTAR